MAARLELTAGQRLVATSTEPYTLVVACPGSGKTTTLCARANDLLRRHNVPPADVLMLTFSVKARKDLQAKLAHMVGPSSSACHVHTFHAFALRLLEVAESALSAAPRATSILSGRQLGEALRAAASSCARADGSTAPADDDELRSLLTILELKKAGAPTPRATEWAYSVIAAYERTTKHAGQVARVARSAAGGAHSSPAAVRDYADLIIDATGLLLAQQPRAAGGSAPRGGSSAAPLGALGAGGAGALQAALGCGAGCVHLLLDEVQDLTKSQLLLVQALLPACRSLVAVGDLDQAIYGWRGADCQPFAFLARCAAPARVRELTLSLNFRCPREVVAAAAAVLRCADDDADDAGGAAAAPRPRKRALEPPPLGRCARAQILVFHTAGEREQQLAAAARVRALQRGGARLGDIVLLCRLNRHADALRRLLANDYQMRAGGSALDGGAREQLAPLLAYLKLACAPDHDESLWRVLNVPSRGLGASAEAYLRCACAKAAEAAGRFGAQASALCVLEALGRRGYPKLPVAEPPSVYSTASKPRAQSLPGPAQAAVAQLCALVRALQAAVQAGSPPSGVVELLLARADFCGHFTKQQQAAQQRPQPAHAGASRGPQAPPGPAFAPRGAAGASQPAALALIRALAAEYSGEEEAGRPDGGAGRALGRLVDDALLAEASGEADALGAGGAASAGGPMVTTIHGAKGREWAHVIVCFADEGVLPLRARGEQMLSTLREEARLCYVAMTRARSSLAFTCGAQPSRFLAAIPEELVLHAEHAEAPPLRPAAAETRSALAGHTVTASAARGS